MTTKSLKGYRVVQDKKGGTRLERIAFYGRKRLLNKKVRQTERLVKNAQKT